MQRYLNYTTQDVNFSPLEWWKAQQKDLPILSRLARQYLCIYATSVQAKRVFSVGGNVVSDSHNSLKSQSVDHLVFFATNL